MTWDSDKSTAVDPDNPQADEQLTADEWDNHVSEGHFPSDELNFGVDGNGDPVITDPQNGGQTVMRYDRSAGSWVVDALEASELIIGGILFEEDANSPIDVSTSSTTYNVSDDYNHIIVIPDAQSIGFNELQINGDTGSNYDYIDNSDTKTTGANHFDIPPAIHHTFFEIFDNGGRIKLSVQNAPSLTGFVIGGENQNLGGNAINSITLSDDGGVSRDLKARIYGRSMDI